MARARMTFLDEREQDLIHEQSLKWLAEIGVKVHSPSVLEMLGERGAVKGVQHPDGRKDDD